MGCIANTREWFGSVTSSKSGLMRLHVVMFCFTTLFAIFATAGDWVIFSNEDLGETRGFKIFSDYAAATSTGDAPVTENGAHLAMGTLSSQATVVAGLVAAIVGLFLSIWLSFFPGKVPKGKGKLLLGIVFFCAFMVLVLMISTQAGFESALSQIVGLMKTFSENQDENVSFEGRGWGYGFCIVSYLAAIPLVVSCGYIFLNDLRGKWDIDRFSTYGVGARSAAQVQQGSPIGPSGTPVPEKLDV